MFRPSRVSPSLFFLGCCTLASQQVGAQQKHIKHGTLGDAIVCVVAADSKELVTDAKIDLMLPENMDTIKGSSIAKANWKRKKGKPDFYKIKVPLGTTSVKFDASGLIFLSPIEILTGAANKKEKTINISQVLITVSKAGYKTFYGPVPVESVQEKSYSVNLASVVLVPESSPYVSYARPSELRHYLSSGTRDGQVESSLLHKIQKQPKDFEARAQLYSLWKSGGSDGKAETALQNMPPPTNSEEELGMTSVLMAQGKTDECIGKLKELASDKKIARNVQLHLGDAYLQQHNSEEAMKSYAAALDDPKSKGRIQFYPCHNYALLLMKKGNINQAREMLGKAISVAQNDPSAEERTTGYTIVQGTMYNLQSGPTRSTRVGFRYPEAANDLIMRDNMDGFQDPEKHWMEAAIFCRALAENGMSELAMPVLDRVKTVHPDDPEVLLAYAIATKLAGDMSRAGEAVKHLLVISPESPEGNELAKEISAHTN